MEQVFRWIGLQVSWGFGLTASETHRQLFDRSSANFAILSSFLKQDGPSCVFVDCNQVRISARRGSAMSAEAPKVFNLGVATSLSVVGVSTRVMYLLKIHFSRNYDEYGAQNIQSILRNEISVGMIDGGNLLRSFETDMEHYFSPHVEKLNTISASNKIDVQSALSTFKGVLAGSVTQHDSSIASYKFNEDAAFSLLAALKLEKSSAANIASPKVLQMMSKSPARKVFSSQFAIDSMTHLGRNFDTDEHNLVQLVEAWSEKLRNIACIKSQRLLSSDDGPLVIADFWKSRLAAVQVALAGIQSSSIQSFFMELKEFSSHRHKFIGTVTKLKSSFDELEEACTKARDIVKFLSVLERCCEAMYQGTPKDIIDGMAGLLQTLSTARFLTQHFSGLSSLTQLFVSISNQLIMNCRKYMNTYGKVWDQPFEELSSRIADCLQVNVVYQKEFVKMKQSSSDLHQSSNGRHGELDLDEALIFDRMEHFSRRLRHIRDLAETMFQFQTVLHSTLPGLQEFIKILVNSFAMLKKTLPFPMDLSASDKFTSIASMVETDVKVSEQGILRFISQAFSESTSAENALLLMNLLKPILQRDNLRTEIDAKYSTIFYRFGHDIKSIASIYDQFKENPPMPRHMGTVSGSVCWSRLLLKKIEEPMMKFQSHHNILNTPESRKIIRLYNKVARVLLEYEERWKRAWISSVEVIETGFQKPLLTKMNDLWMFNLDTDCMELIKDARYLERIGWMIPESAMVYLHQESKFASIMHRVSLLVRSVNSSRHGVPQSAFDLFICLIRSLDLAMEPSLSSISLSSAMLDSWLQKCEIMVTKFKATLYFWKDSMRTRVESGLSFMKKKLQFYAPTSCCSIEQFSMFQEAHIKKQSKNVQRMNIQIENGLNDACQAIVQLAITFGASESSLKQLDKAIVDWKSMYANRMYSTILHCVQKSFINLKAQFLSENPAFVVEAVIVGTHVTIRPSIDDIQSVLNSCAQFITRATKRISPWAFNNHSLQSASLFDRIASDLEVVKMILLMCGCFHGMKFTTEAFLKANLYGNQSIWISDINSDVPKFLLTNPEVHDFVRILDAFKQSSDANAKIFEEFIVGSLKVTTSSFKASIDALILAGKSKYGVALLNYIKASVENDLKWLKSATEKVQAPVITLTDAAAAMEFLHEIRLMSSSLEAKLQFAQTGYQVLATFGVQSSADAQSLLTYLKSGWNSLNLASSNLSDSLKSRERQFRSNLFVLSGTVSQEISNFCSEFELTGPLVPGISVQQACQRVSKFNEHIKDQYSRLTSSNRAERLFGIHPSSYARLDQIRTELQHADRLFSLYFQVNSSTAALTASSWNSSKNTSFSAVSSFNDIFLTFQEYLSQFDKFPKVIKQWDSALQLKELLDHTLLIMPLVILLSSPSVMPRHWLEVSSLLKKSCNPEDPKFTVGSFMHSNVQEHVEAIEAVCAHSAKECALEAKFESLTSEWAAVVFSLAKFKTKGPFILKGIETQELIEKLEEALMVLGGIMASRYVTFMRDKVVRWSSMLANVGELMENWLSLQATWMYLEAVFSSGDIAKQLPQESKRFSLVDKMFAKIMIKAYEVESVLEYVRTTDDLRKSIVHMTEQLELCQKSLSGYLEQKRNQFFRFYFVSDPVILEILSQSSDPTAIQPHLQSVFDNLFQIVFSHVDIQIVERMQSSEGEEVVLSSQVHTSAHIEDWLNLLLEESKCTINDNICDCVDNLPVSDMHEYLSTTLGQISLLGLQIDWTFTIENSIELLKQEKTALATAVKSCQATMNSLTDLTLRQISALVRSKLETAITIQVNQRDTAELLQSKKVRTTEDFEWQKITKFSWQRSQNSCIIRAADMTFPYNCEYLGCRDRLVITPLTERCYITLTQALGMCFGGAPAGPAGTGKTETVKDLGRALGMYVVVFNCSDQMDFRALGKIIKGLSQSGAWGCFDEFNRIDLPVLSVVAQQVQCIQSELRAKKKYLIFTDGCTISLHDQVGFFITMNPGYAGRQELPENLKSLFRGVTMMVPDRQSIIKVKLASCGFYQTSELSKKFHVLYRLCEQQLSKQPHYDFGLRNILSVLRTAANSKKENPSEPESTLLLRSLRDMNLSKFASDDVPLFLSLLGDLFPGISVEKNSNDRLDSALVSNIQKSGLSYDLGWVSKIIELNSMVLVRHGVMIVGSAGSGKTCCMNILRESLNEIEVPHKEIRMNPKAITSSQMFGKLDSLSNDWTDGIFSAIWRKTCKTKNSNVWITLDGPVDAIWIENLNTVLDDNKLLTLANGDRISMGSHMRLMFEVENLLNASPATVSRAGIVFLSESTLGWAPFVSSWLYSRSSDQQSFLQKQVFAIIHALSFDESKFSSYISIPFTSRVKNGLSLLDQLIFDAGNTADHVLEALICFAMAWCIGGIFEHQGRLYIDKLLKLNKLGELVPRNASIFEGFVSNDGYWQSWSSATPTWKFKKEEPFLNMVVPTEESVRISFLMGMILKTRAHVLLVGPSGSAKTSIIDSFIAAMLQQHDSFVSQKVNLSSALSPLDFQLAVENWVEKRQGRTFGPPAGKSLLVFVDDCNLPRINQWKDQPTNEMCRQFVEFNGCYNLERPGEWKNIVDLRWFLSMVSPGSSSNDIPARLKRHFTVFGIPLPNNNVIESIFGSIIRGHSEERGLDLRKGQLFAEMPAATTALWNSIQAKLLPTPSKFYFVFNLRDISRIFQGILLAPCSSLLAPMNIISLWIHECTRVFVDRIIDLQELIWLQDEMKRVALLSFSLDKESIASCFAQSSNSVWVHFMRDAEDTNVDESKLESLKAPCIYESCSIDNELKPRCYIMMQRFNSHPSNKGKKLDLVLFKDALVHTAKVCRILQLDRGHALLLGVGGSGKQCVARLSAFISGVKLLQMQSSPGYGVLNFLDDIKSLFRCAGVVGENTCLLITENDLKTDSFLSIVSSLLSISDVPSLFQKDETEVLIADLRVILIQRKILFDDSHAGIMKMFRERVNKYFHIVVTFSPVGSRFNSVCREFPGFLNGCTINAFGAWPVPALELIAHKKVLDVLSKSIILRDASTSTSFAKSVACTQSLALESAEFLMQKYGQRTYFTPKTYLTFLDTFVELYLKKFHHISTQSIKVRGGLDKLLSAVQDVAKMKLTLKDVEKSLSVTRIKTSELLRNVTASTTRAEKDRLEVEQVANILLEEAHIIEKDRLETEQDLLIAKPALLEAEAALKMVSSKDVQTLKKLANPPDLIKRIFDGVLILKGAKLDKWTQAEVKGRIQMKDSYSISQKIMGESSFIESLINFPKETINPEQIELLQPYLDMPDFNFENGKKASGNVAGLCSWVRSMSVYYVVARDIAPKIAALQVADSKMKTANAKLQKTREELQVKVDKVAAMQLEFDAAMAEKQNIEDEADRTRRRLETADALILGLSDERQRWTLQISEFEGELIRLIGDVSISAAFLTYCGSFSQEIRDDFLQNVMQSSNALNLPSTPDFKFLPFLASDGSIGEWNLQGLPTDNTSIQNGVIVSNTLRYPFLIDPQEQAMNWILNKEKMNGLKRTSFKNKRFRPILEESMSLGCPLLVEDASDQMESFMDSIFDKAVIQVGSGFSIVVGDKECEFCVGFSLYMTSKESNPVLSPEVCAKICLINFSVTLKGLEDQLLGRIVQMERPELEETRLMLLEELTGNTLKIAGLQNDLLDRLSNSEGSLVEDESLVIMLKVTKDTVKETRDKVTTVQETQHQISSTREEYRPVAQRGADLYSSMTEIAKLSTMYQYSLKQFLSLFDLAAAKPSADAKSINARVQSIVLSETALIFQVVSRGLFQKHKRVFAFLLMLKVELSNGRCSSIDYQTLVSHPTLPAGFKPTDPPFPMNAETWSRFYAICIKISSIKDVMESMHAAAWRDWHSSKAPEENLSAVLSVPVNPIHEFLIVSSLREDRVPQAAQQAVARSLGFDTILSKFEISNIIHAAGCKIPILFILSPGSDPTAEIEASAKSRKIGFKSISMGQGQEIAARAAIEACKESAGSWLLFQNGHLGLNFMSELSDLISSLEVPDNSFRIIITSESNDLFPPQLLHKSIKLVNEPPQGLRAGLARSCDSISQDFLDSVAAPEWKLLVYSVMFLHSVVQERRKFGPMGWNIPYEFNAGDMNASMSFCRKHFRASENSGRPVSWPTVKYMVCEIQYGGRVTDDYDRRLLNVIGDKWLSSKMMHPDMEFSKGYGFPPLHSFELTKTFINEMPSYDSHDIFGFQSNAETSVSIAYGIEFKALFSMTQPRSGPVGKMPGSHILDSVTAYEKYLPSDFNLSGMKDAIKRLGGPKPLNIFLGQEIACFQPTLTAVRNHLRDIPLAMEGKIALGPELSDAVSSISRGVPPSSWTKNSWSSSTLGSWIKILTRRATQLNVWLTGQQRPSSLWLPGFFNPQGLLTAAKQEVARKRSWALNDVILQTKITKYLKEDDVDSPIEGVHLHGLFLQGAAWDLRIQKLVDLPPQLLSVQLPVLLISGTLQTDKPSETTSYECPLYQYPSRTGSNFIAQLDLPTEDPPPKWILKGVCALCSLDE